MNQLALAVTLPQDVTLESFIPGQNRQLLTDLLAWLPDKGRHPFYVFGPLGSGKTHLLLGACALGEKKGLRCAYIPLEEMRQHSSSLLDGLSSLDLIALDDIHSIAGDSQWEEALFVLFNEALEHGARLLFAANTGPAALPLQLPDLKSRLAWGSVYRAFPLDESGLLDLLHQQAHKRGWNMQRGVADYLLARCSRNTHDLMALLDDLDHASLARQRRLTVPFIRSQLTERTP